MSSWGSRLASQLSLAIALTWLVAAPALAQPTTTRVSVATGGAQGNGESAGAVISADGRWIAFASSASNLVPDDTNGARDVFLRDRQTGITTRVSIATGGTQGNGGSASPSVSADGRWIAFASFASNLVPGDTNGVTDVFVHDRQTGVSTRISVGPGGAQGDGQSDYPSISADGRSVAFQSAASNLVPGDTNGAPTTYPGGSPDIFVHDLHTGTTVRVSVGTAGAQANDLSQHARIGQDGRWVVFGSGATNLVPGGTSPNDVLIHDREKGITTRVSVGPGGVQANGWSFSIGQGAISADGRHVAFQSLATNLVPDDTNGANDVFVFDRHSGIATRESVGPSGAQANGPSGGGGISADGRWVAFGSSASNLVPADTNGQPDVFVHDRQTGTTTLVSVGSGGEQGNGFSYGDSISASGRWVVFTSAADNLVDGDTNGVEDVFVRDRGEMGCAAILAPPAAEAAGAGRTGRALVLADAGCGWTARSNDPAWLTVTGDAGGSGFGVVEYSVAPNAGAARAGTLLIGGQVFTVEQADARAPMAPTGLIAQSIFANKVTLRWTPPSEGPSPTGYVLEGGVQPGETLLSVPVGTAPTYSFESPTGSFYVRAFAVNDGVRSAASNEVRIHVNVPVAPSAPSRVLATVDGTAVTFAWRNTFEGGTPASLELRVRNVPPFPTIPLGLANHVTVEGVPPGTYDVVIHARNAWGRSVESSPLTLVVPGPCPGPPGPPDVVLAYASGRTVTVDWLPSAIGPAPTSYAVIVTGSWSGSFTTTAPAVSGTVAPGTYEFSVVAVNPCGVSAGSPPRTIVVP